MIIQGIGALERGAKATQQGLLAAARDLQGRVGLPLPRLEWLI